MSEKQNIAGLLTNLTDAELTEVADFCIYLSFRRMLRKDKPTQHVATQSIEASRYPSGGLQNKREMLTWATSVVETMAEAAFWIDYEAQLAESQRQAERYRLLTKLSALIDCGRWFFPNQDADQIGTEKELAYRGTRQLALNAILTAFHAIEACDSETGNQRKTRKEQIVQAKRIFVSEVHSVLLSRNSQT